MRIPDELSVVGYDDYRLFSEGLRPALTTVALPYQRMGRIAADLLLQRITTARSEAETIRVQGPLVERRSTAARRERRGARDLTKEEANWKREEVR